MSDLSKRLGEFLKIQRADLTMHEVNLATGVSKSLLSNYEQGKHTPSLENLLKLLEYYETPLEEMLCLLYEAHYSKGKIQQIKSSWAEKQLSDQERKLLQIFRALTEKRQQEILEQLCRG